MKPKLLNLNFLEFPVNRVEVDYCGIKVFINIAADLFSVEVCSYVFYEKPFFQQMVGSALSDCLQLSPPFEYFRKFNLW